MSKNTYDIKYKPGHRANQPVYVDEYAARHAERAKGIAKDVDEMRRKAIELKERRAAEKARKEAEARAAAEAEQAQENPHLTEEVEV